MRIKIGDSSLFFDVEGSKLVPDGPRMRERRTLLLIHGGGISMDHSTFRPDLSPLADVAQLVYLDIRGAGRSDRGSEEQWTLDCWAKDVRDFCDALEIEKPVVLGVSHGGFIVLAYAMRYPDHPGKLILYSTSAHPEIARQLAVFERLGGKEAREAWRRFCENPSAKTFGPCQPFFNRRPLGPEFFSRIASDPSLGVRGNLDFDFRPMLGRIRCPTLVLGGEDDPACPIEDAAEMAGLIPKHLVRFERFANAGHGLSHDAPEQFLRVVREFISA